MTKFYPFSIEYIFEFQDFSLGKVSTEVLKFTIESFNLIFWKQNIDIMLLNLGVKISSDQNSKFTIGRASNIAYLVCLL